MKRLSIAVSLAASLWACADGKPASPTEPPRATYTLSGVVSEVTPTGQALVEGARVEVSNPNLAATTDISGSYRIDGVYAGPISVRVSTGGYETVIRDVTINGDTRLDIQLVRRPPYTLFGVVSELTSTGQVHVEGVTVLEIYSRAEVMTDTNGFYSLTGFRAGDRAYLVFSKEGYQNVESDMTLTLIGDTRLDVQLVRR